MVSGKHLMSESEKGDFDRLGLSRYATERVHERVKREAESKVEGEDKTINDLSAGEWKECVSVATSIIMRNNTGFKNRCEKDWDIEPTGRKGRRRARITALREAENGN